MLLDTGNFTTCSICHCYFFLVEFVFISSCNTTCAVTTHIIASRHDTYLVSVKHPGKESKWKCLRQHNTRCQLVFYLHLLSFVLALPFSMSLYEVNCKPDMSPEYVVTARGYSWGFIIFFFFWEGLCKSISALHFVESYRRYFLLLKIKISDRFVLDCSAVFEFDLKTGKKKVKSQLIIIEHRMIVCVNLSSNCGLSCMPQFLMTLPIITCLAQALD